MTVCHRIVKTRYSSTAFSGEGSDLVPGRWNERGYRVVYTADSRALAALEILVNAGRGSAQRLAFSMLAASIPDTLSITRVEIDDLPLDWRTARPVDATRRIGTQWLVEGKSAILCVPSAVIPQERTYVLNPLHPDFVKITISQPQPFLFDSRL